MKKQQKPFDFEDFRNGRCAVECRTKSAFDWFMKECKQKGIRWASGMEADQFCTMVLPTYLVMSDGSLMFSYMLASLYGKPIHDAAVLMMGAALRKGAPQKPVSTVILRSDGDTTASYLKCDERIVRKSRAKRSPEDEPDDLIGFMLAMLRLFDQDHTFEFDPDSKTFSGRKEKPEVHDFGWAIRQLKQGRKLTRAGWNGKGQYIQLASAISYKSPDGETVNADHKDVGNKAIAFVGTRGVQMGWLASQADMLAEDWELIFHS